jgi:hypothetical protein
MIVLPHQRRLVHSVQILNPVVYECVSDRRYIHIHCQQSSIECECMRLKQFIQNVYMNNMIYMQQEAEARGVHTKHKQCSSRTCNCQTFTTKLLQVIELTALSLGVHGEIGSVTVGVFTP